MKTASICTSLFARNEFLKFILFAVPVIFPSLLRAQNVYGDAPYGAYALFPQGSDRVMALGGASVAISDDAAAILFNPAGPALAKWSFDIGSTNNKIDHQELGYNFPETYGSYETKYDSPYSYFFYAAAARSGPWVFGLSYSSPFFYEFSDINPISQLEIARFEVKIQSIDLMVARKFGEFFSIGIAGHAETLREYYNNRSLPAPIPDGFETKATNSYLSAGVLYRQDWFGIGLSYSQRRTFMVDTSANSLLATYNTTPFRDVVIPSRTSIGVFIRPIQRLMLTVDADMIEKLDKPAVYVSAATTSTEFLKDEKVTLVHGGIEVEAIKAKNYGFVLRTGTYREPTRFTNGRDRQHMTYGATLRLGIAILSYGADQADKFLNSAYSASIKLDSF